MADVRALREEFFGHTAYQELPGGRKKLEVLLALLLPHVGCREAFRVLDVGCGNGGLALPVAALGFPVLGVDIHPQCVEYCSRRNPFGNASFRLVRGDSFRLGEEFQLVICSEVLEHVRRPLDMARTLAAHLAPGGLVLVTVPNGFGPREVLGRAEAFLRERFGADRPAEWLRRRLGMMPTARKCRLYTSNPDQGHHHRFTFGRLVGLLAEARLHVMFAVNSFWIFSLFFRDGGRLGKAVERWDEWVADLLPRALCSGWYLVASSDAGAASRVGQFEQCLRRVREAAQAVEVV